MINIGDIMDLIGSLTDENNVRGITLNSQNIDLFNIIEQLKSREEAMQKVPHRRLREL